IGRGLTGACAELRKVLNVRDVTRDPRFIGVIPGTRSEICVPLAVRDDVIGVLSVESPKVGAFTAADEEELSAFAQLVALAIVHTRADAARRQDIAELQALSEVASRAVALDLEGTLNAVVSSFMEITTSDSVAIFLWDDASQKLVCSALAFEASQYPADYRERIRPVAVGEGVTGWAAKTREAALIPDVSKDPHAVAITGVPLGEKAGIVVPLSVEDELLGVIRAVKVGAGSYTADHFRLARSLADQAALAIAAARAHREQGERLEELTVLGDISQRLSEVSTLSQVLNSAIDGAMRITGAEAGLVWRRGDDRLFRLAASINLDADRLAQSPPNQPYSHSNEMHRSGKPILLDDLTKSRGVVSGAALADFRALLGVPLRSEGHMYGSLYVVHPRAGYFNERHVQQVQVVAAHAGAALARAHAFEEATRLSITDELTGFFNSRYLNARLQEEIARAMRYGHELALVLIDSDALKRVNDQLGHEAGNEHLRRLAKTIRAHVRATDIVARYGGDEFVVLQPEAGLDAARATAERIRMAASVQQEGIATSVSIGVAAFPHVREADALFREADRALSAAKQRGKNTVVVSDAAT
ncbi:MAG TPA: GAF domain-containing protein, partial [Candidatus Limnocylindria bacterium]|nr:GAF domain-containing protein [Candidatus Limnocylindria bacterium]